MNLSTLTQNYVLIGASLAWFLAQVFKIPLEYMRSKKWEWVLLLRAGGMPSSHSAFISATAHGIGLFVGWDSPLFALAVGMAIIVIYDATGVRREAGRHAELINAIIRDMREGHLPSIETQEKLKEVLGHTPLEAIMGTLLGIVIAQLVWFRWG